MTDTTQADEREAINAFWKWRSEQESEEGHSALMRSAWIAALAWQARAASQPAPEPEIVYAVPSDHSDGQGRQLYTITDEPIPMADNWRLKSHPSAKKQWMRAASQPAQEPVARLHPTDIYDFAGWLTTRPGMMKVGGAFNAAPMADAVGEYLDKFPERFAAPPADSARADRIMELVRRYGSICAVHQKAASEGLNPTGVNVNEAYAALEREVRKP